jgi:hypothetical protein
MIKPEARCNVPLSGAAPLKRSLGFPHVVPRAQARHYRRRGVRSKPAISQLKLSKTALSE